MTTVELLQRLIRFDTTNPPGDEAECVAFVRGLLDEAGIESELHERTAGRPNLVARLRGGGSKPGLMLYGHVDVVTARGQDWRHPPFAGELADGFVWGRGALDMKGGVAMLVQAFLRAKDLPLAGDVVLTILADEENGGFDGARFLVEERAELFAGVTHALGEFGAFTLPLGGRRFYPIQVTEKQRCLVRARVRGSGGHGSVPVRGRTPGRLGDVLRALDRRQPPIHVTPVARAFLEGLAAHLPRSQAIGVRALLRPALAERLLPRLGPRFAGVGAMLRNTATATVVRAGEQDNVIPAEAELTLDGRVLPGLGPDELVRELRELLGDDVELEIVWFDELPGDPDLTHFATLADVLRGFDPEGIPVPLMQVGVTDGRLFARLGIQTYGFLPMRLPDDLVLTELIHAADERIPADTLEDGAAAIHEAVRRISCAA
ncbi:MAG: M20/M25/M40 family metallo-hydrolase [Thermoleophilia bacterium]|nr:M20/M25/M40 family metallo-hydrolase [Thermoleophilia bacterium]